jgi:hypothetical protein
VSEGARLNETENARAATAASAATAAAAAAAAVTACVFAAAAVGVVVDDDVRDKYDCECVGEAVRDDVLLPLPLNDKGIDDIDP